MSWNSQEIFFHLETSSVYSTSLRKGRITATLSAKFFIREVDTFHYKRRNSWMRLVRCTMPLLITNRESFGYKKVLQIVWTFDLNRKQIIRKWETQSRVWQDICRHLRGNSCDRWRQVEKDHLNYWHWQWNNTDSLLREINLRKPYYKLVSYMRENVSMFEKNTKFGNIFIFKNWYILENVF